MIVTGRRWVAAFAMMVVTTSNTSAFVHAPSPTTTRTGMDMTAATEGTGDVDGRRKFLDGVAAAIFVGAGTLGLPETAIASDPFHKVDYPIQGKCGQADNVPENAVFFVKKFGGFQDGGCATEGYDVEEGKEKGTGEKDKEREYTIYGK